MRRARESTVSRSPDPIAALSACAENAADRWEDLGALPALATTALNHTPMVESGGRILVGHQRRHLGAARRRARANGSQAGLAGIGVFATRRHPTIECDPVRGRAAGRRSRGARRSIVPMTAARPGYRVPRFRAIPSTAPPNRSSTSPSRPTIRTGCTRTSPGRPSRSRRTAGRTGCSPTARPRSSSAIPA